MSIGLRKWAMGSNQCRLVLTMTWA
jgi:hypothetical protein